MNSKRAKLIRPLATAMVLLSLLAITDGAEVVLDTNALLRIEVTSEVVTNSVGPKFLIQLYAITNTLNWHFEYGGGDPCVAKVNDALRFPKEAYESLYVWSNRVTRILAGEIVVATASTNTFLGRIVKTKTISQILFTNESQRFETVADLSQRGLIWRDSP